MAACVCGLAVGGTTLIRGWDAVATSYPGFAAEVARLTGGSVTLAAVPPEAAGAAGGRDGSGHGG
jgi:3-phosphoshikimate 1-carboxyvinyltransferase